MSFIYVYNSWLLPSAREMINFSGRKPRKSWKQQKYLNCSCRAHKLVREVMRKLLGFPSLAVKYFIHVCGVCVGRGVAAQRVSKQGFKETISRFCWASQPRDTKVFVNNIDYLICIEYSLACCMERCFTMCDLLTSELWGCGSGFKNRVL